MNAKYMAVLAAIMMFAGCAVVLVGTEASDMDATDTATKNVYVVYGKTATLNINTTETALGSYVNTVAWNYGEETIAGSEVETPKTASITSGDNQIATASISGTNGSYTFTFTGKAAGTATAIFVYSVTTDINDAKDDAEDLSQSITYTINLTVLPASFTAAYGEDVAFNNRVAVEEAVAITCTVTGSTETLVAADYYFYAVGLPDGLAMGDDGKIYGTPNVKETDFGGSKTKTYPVTIIATHQASNLAINGTLALTVNKNSDAFTFEVTGEVKKVTDEIYKVIRGDNSSITITTTVGDVNTTIDSVTIIDETGGVYSQVPVSPDSGSEGQYTIDVDTTGTGVYTIYMVNGSVQQAIQLVVVEPLADVVADIGFTPGVGNTNPKLN